MLREFAGVSDVTSSRREREILISQLDESRERKRRRERERESERGEGIISE